MKEIIKTKGKHQMSKDKLFSDLILEILKNQDLAQEVADEFKVSESTLKRWSIEQSLPPKDVRFTIALRIGKMLLSKHREEKRKRIEQSIKKAEEEGLYELSEHLTSNIDLDYED
jgi:hypothetical protein